MLKGIDISKWNKNVDYKSPDFIIIKASEGVNYKDPLLDFHYNNLNSIKKEDKLYGFYHYARPELGNSGEDEAKSFLSYVGHHAGKCLYVLDWEGNALKYPIEWAIEFLDYVYAHTGVKPLIYCSASVTKTLQKVYEKDYGLWVAHYGVSTPSIRVYPFWAMWQYTSSPIDCNYFNGNRNTFKKYCEVNK